MPLWKWQEIQKVLPAIARFEAYNVRNFAVSVTGGKARMPKTLILLADAEIALATQHPAAKILRHSKSSGTVKRRKP